MHALLSVLVHAHECHICSWCTHDQRLHIPCAHAVHVFAVNLGNHVAYVYMYVCIFLVCVCIYIYIYVCVYMYIYIYTHTYIYTCNRSTTLERVAKHSTYVYTHACIHIPAFTTPKRIYVGTYITLYICIHACPSKAQLQPLKGKTHTHIHPHVYIPACTMPERIAAPSSMSD